MITDSTELSYWICFLISPYWLNLEYLQPWFDKYYWTPWNWNWYNWLLSISWWWFSEHYLKPIDSETVLHFPIEWLSTIHWMGLFWYKVFLQECNHHHILLIISMLSLDKHLLTIWISIQWSSYWIDSEI